MSQLTPQQQYAYDLNKQLTFFVISAEMVFCGYVLLNAKEFQGFTYTNELFLISGLAALCGIFWRVFYNQHFHVRAHSYGVRMSRLVLVGIRVFYPLYVFLSVLFFCSLVYFGYEYLSSLESSAQRW